MKYRIVGAGIVFVLLLGACAPAGATEAPAQATAVVPEMTDASASDAAGGKVIMSGQSGNGLILVNDKGIPLYIFTADTQGSGVSTCNEDDGCSADYLPFVSEGEPVPGEGVDPTLLGTLTREDGTKQVTYNGWPLYTYKQDTMAGDQYGEGRDAFGGLWHWITPTGESLQFKD